MIKKLIKFFFIFLRSEVFFSKPKYSSVIFIGKPNYHFSLFSKKNFNNLSADKNNTIPVWREYHNFFIILKCLIKLKFTFLEYCQEYISTVKPKLIISFLDNYDLIYKIKIKNCKKVVVQNSYRYGSNILNFQLKSIKRNSVDHVFVYNKNIGKIFNKHLDTQIHPVGSFLLNSLNLKKNNQIIYKYLYISTYRPIANDNQKISPYTSYEKFQDQEKKLVKTIHNYLLMKNETLHILGVNKFSFGEEYDYFKNIIKNDKCWNFIKPKNRHYSFAYECVNLSDIILGIDSSLLYESIALGKKTIFFNCRVLDSYLKENRYFAWPKKMDRAGLFWTDDLLKENVSKLIDNVEHMNNDEWLKKIKKYQSELIEYDRNNETFKNQISKIL